MMENKQRVDGSVPVAPVPEVRRLGELPLAAAAVPWRRLPAAAVPVLLLLQLLLLPVLLLLRLLLLPWHLLLKARRLRRRPEQRMAILHVADSQPLRPRPSLAAAGRDGPARPHIGGRLSSGVVTADTARQYVIESAGDHHAACRRTAVHLQLCFLATGNRTAALRRRRHRAGGGGGVCSPRHIDGPVGARVLRHVGLEQTLQLRSSSRTSRARRELQPR